MNMLISCRTVSAFAASCSCNVNIMPHNIARTTQPRPQRSCNCEHRLATGPNDNATKTTDRRTKQTATVYCDSAFRSGSSSDLRTPQDTVKASNVRAQPKQDRTLSQSNNQFIVPTPLRFDKVLVKVRQQISRMQFYLDHSV